MKFLKVLATAPSLLCTRRSCRRSSGRLFRASPGELLLRVAHPRQNLARHHDGGPRDHHEREQVRQTSPVRPARQTAQHTHQEREASGKEVEDESNPTKFVVRPY